MSARHMPGRGCPECAWGKVAGCWRCGSRISTPAREPWERYFTADIAAAKAAQRCALSMRHLGFATEFVAQARSIRDAHIVSARLNLQAIAKTTGSASA